MKRSAIFPAMLLSAALHLNPDAFSQEQEPGNSIGRTSYKTALGLRAGLTSGLTVKHFFNEHNAMEGIVGFFPYALSFTALYEKHARAFDLTGMKWYYGAGAHLGIRTARAYYVYYEDRRYTRYSSGDLGIGIDGILGLEYKIEPIPFAVGIDLKPFAEVVSNGNLYVAADAGVSLRFTF